MGDGLMASANLLQGHADPVLASVRCAFALIEAAGTNPAAWQLRVGIHVGPVVAGVVGRAKFSFDLWGDTVNVAARLSMLGADAAIYERRCLGAGRRPLPRRAARADRRQRQGRDRGLSLHRHLAGTCSGEERHRARAWRRALSITVDGSGNRVPGAPSWRAAMYFVDFAVGAA